MVFGKKKETTEVKVARAVGRAAGKAVKVGKKAAATAVRAGRATRGTAAKVAGSVSRQRQAAKRAAARRKVLEQAGRTLKTVGKAAAAVGLSAAAVVGVAEVAKRRRK
jgi:hypothetical protein